MNTNGNINNHKLLDVQAAYDFMTISSGYYWTPTTALVLKADVVASTVTNADELLYGADTPASQDGKITWHDIYVFLDYANPLR